ncbi:MAG: TolC family protein [Acidobacteriota bacterium]|nr:TolC family protein [Acidobacteriota bacterium]
MNFRHTVLVLIFSLFCAATVAGQQSGNTQSGGQTSSPNPNAAGQSGGASSNPQTGPASGRTGQQQQGAPAQGGQIGGPPSTRTQPTITGQQQLPGAAKVTLAPSALSLAQAIQLAIQNNVTTLLARERRREAEGLKQESLAGLLPNISGTAYQASITQNLAALGFQPGTFPGITRTFIGPFNNFDARARLVQTIFSLSAIRNYRAGRAGVRIAELQEQLAREQVASFTALTYLEALRTDRAVSAAQANVELAQMLLKLATDQRNAGVATGVDVTRAETRLAQEQLRLAQAETSSEQARLNLQRVVGLPLGGSLTLTDQLRFTDEPEPAPDAAVAQARENRREVSIAEEQLRLNDLERKAVEAEFLPSLEFVGDYGVSGITPTNTALPTRRAAIQLNVPIFNGGLTRGRLTVATSRERQAELELGSVRGQVEEDVRLALVTLRTAVAQVRAADESVRLAQRELEMARDRFRAGVGDNLEVVNAQTALANARDAQVNALAQYNAARLNLAASVGRAESFRW